MINSLQSLRFIFALMIFFHHYSIGNVSLFPAGGACGVSFFLILSGFVMSIGYHDRVLRADFSYKHFLIKRLSRLWPLHILCLLLSIALGYKTITLLGLVKLIPNALMLQSWLPNSNFYFSGNAVSWFLTDMVFFYVTYPLIARKMRRLRKDWLFIGAIGVIFVYLLILSFISEDWRHPILYICPLFRLIDFMIGVMLYHAYRFMDSELGNKILNLSNARKTGIEFASVLCLTGIVILYSEANKLFVMASYYWLPMSLLILIFGLFNKSGGVISRILNNRFMVYCGNISFDFYMIHALTIRTMKSAVKKLSLNPNSYYLIPVVIVVVLIASHLLYNYFEKPIAKAI